MELNGEGVSSSDTVENINTNNEQGNFEGRDVRNRLSEVEKMSKNSKKA